MLSYQLIRLLLLVGFVLIALVIMKPVRSQSHLAVRRFSILALLLFAVSAILFPGTLNHVAHRPEVERGVNLLAYVLVVAFFAQLVSSCRKKAAQGRRITALTRVIALTNVDESELDSALHTGVEGSRNNEEHRECMGWSGEYNATIRD